MKAQLWGLSWEAWLTVAVVVGLLVALLSRRVSGDVAFLGSLAILLLAGILKPAEAVAGFANPAVIAVGLLYVVAEGLRETGGMVTISRRLLGQPKSQLEAQARLVLPVTGMSAFLNNTPIVAMFLPVLSGWARRSGLNPAGLFMPLSFAAMLGGICTLIGTSTNIVVNELLIEHAKQLPGATDVQPMGMFTISRVGVPVAIAGTAYMLLAGRRLLPRRPDPGAAADDPRQYTVWMRILPGSPIVGRTIEQAQLRHLSGLFLAEIDRWDEQLVAVGPEQILRADDRLRFVGLIESVLELQQIQGLVPETEQIRKLDEPRRNRRLTEAVISEASPLVGQSIRESGFRTRYNAVIIAVHRAGERIRSKIGDIVLRPGDTLLLEAPAGFVQQHRNSSSFYLLSELPQSAELRWNLGWVALANLAGLVACLGFGWLDLVTATLAAALVMILTRCCTGVQARQAIDWQVLIMVGASFGIARAMASTGLAPAAAQAVLGWTAPLGLRAGLAGVFALTICFTALMSNNAAAALVLPIAMHAAAAQRAPLMPFAICVAIAASSDFITPIGYQTNLMVMGPGGYTWGDFLRFGVPLTLIVGVVCVALIPLMYG